MVWFKMVTRTEVCPRCKGTGETSHTFYPSPCCGEPILSSFGESYCSKCRRDTEYIVEIKK